jgi:hypothetical protein
MTIRATMELISATEWKRECIDIRRKVKGRQTTHPVKAWRYRDMAVHHVSTGKGELKDWSITHVPSGLKFPRDFKTCQIAMACAVELDRLRNNWADIDQEDVNNVKARAVEILHKYSGQYRSGGGAMSPRCDLNGYGG